MALNSLPQVTHWRSQTHIMICTHTHTIQSEFDPWLFLSLCNCKVSLIANWSLLALGSSFGFKLFPKITRNRKWDKRTVFELEFHISLKEAFIRWSKTFTIFCKWKKKKHQDNINGWWTWNGKIQRIKATLGFFFWLAFVYIAWKASL